jgi:hypothetical protein
MLQAIIEGKRDAGWMADYAQGKLRGKRGELELALEGTFTDEQRWLLAKELRQIEWLEGQACAREQEIERRVAVFEEPIQRLLTIPGIDRKTAWTLVAEIGVDLSAFADAKHLASWAGLCPGNRESGGKRFSGRTRKANRYVKRAMCQAAWAASPTKNTYLSAFYRRMSIRKGAPKAVIALAHHMITVVHQVLSRKEEYVELGGDYYDQRNKPKTAARLMARLEKLGYQVEVKVIRDAAGRVRSASGACGSRQWRQALAAGTGTAEATKGTSVQVHRARNYLQTRDLNWAYSVDSAGASGREIFVGFN